MDNKLDILEHHEIRRTLHDNEWWYVVEDVILTLAGSKDPKNYIRHMKQRDPELGKGWAQIVRPLTINTATGFQKIPCANMEGLFRIIQSIPTSAPEPYKQWLAKVGYERILEFGDPESVSGHRRGDTKSGGIQAHGSKNVSTQTNNFEVILSMLEEAATNKIAGNQDLQGVCGNALAAEKGGLIAGKAREYLEEETCSKVSTLENYPDETRGLCHE